MTIRGLPRWSVTRRRSVGRLGSVADLLSCGDAHLRLAAESPTTRGEQGGRPAPAPGAGPGDPPVAKRRTRPGPPPRAGVSDSMCIASLRRSRSGRTDLAHRAEQGLDLCTAVVGRMHDRAAEDDVVGQQGAGNSVVTIFVDDLDAHVAAIAARGLKPEERLTYSNGVRKALYRDADGNELGFGGAPLDTGS